MNEPWRKLGCVLQASGDPLQRSHAMLPTPYVMDDRVRVFYAACDDNIRGRIFWADFAPEPPFHLIGRANAPALDLGAEGAFDCDGVNPSQALVVDGRLVLFYIGWRRGGPDEPYTLFAGLAFSDDDGVAFQRQAEPLLAPCPGERLFRTAPFVERRPDGWRMLYIGGDTFGALRGDKRLPTYSLMETTSDDPFAWTAPSRRLLDPDTAAGEIGFGRPVITALDGERRLLLSVRTRDGYRLVETEPQFAPRQRPPMRDVIPGPLEPWECEMTCFGAPCRAGAYDLLFYNGNGFGRSGTGLAWRPAG